MPRAKASSLSLELHLALAALRCGEGLTNQAGLLLRTALLGYFISREQGKADQECVFLDAKVALTDAFDRVESGEAWRLEEGEFGTLCKAVSLHDAQLAHSPSHIYDKCCQHTLNFLSSSLTDMEGGEAAH